MNLQFRQIAWNHMDSLACYFCKPIRIAYYSSLGVVVSHFQVISSCFDWVAAKVALDC